MENLLRGKLLPMWRWAFATIKNESDTKVWLQSLARSVSN